MENFIIISPELQTDVLFTYTLNSNTIAFNYTIPKPLENGSLEGTQSTPTDVLDTIGTNNIKHLALAYHYNGFNKIPFFSNSSPVECDENSTYKYFSNDLIDLFKQINEKINESLIVDILTCSLNNPEFKKCVEQIENDLGINIRYSLDQTGNSPQGNWILESDNADVKDVYFTEDINNWTDVLSGDITSIAQAGDITGISWDAGTSTYTMTQNVTWWGTYGGHTINKNCYIDLGSGGTFDGAGYEIDMSNTGANGWAGLFKCSDISGSPSIITNVHVTSDVNTWGNFCGYSNGGGYIIKSSQRFFEMSNCTVTGGTCYGGGIMCGGGVGYRGVCSITNCKVIGGKLIGNHVGTITGGSAGGGSNSAANNLGKCTITNCYAIDVDTDVNGQGQGGICGGETARYGECHIIGCYTNFDMRRSHSGGIVGERSGKWGTLTITKCYSTGNTTGNYSGGIGGYELRGPVNTGPAPIITDCYTTGNMTGQFSGGFAGGGCGAEFIRCYASGTTSYGITQQWVGGYSETDCYTKQVGSVYGTYDVATISNGSKETLGNNFNAVASSYPILVAFQASPWETDTGSADYYDLYTDNAKFGTSGGTTAEETEADAAEVDSNDIATIVANNNLSNDQSTTIPENSISAGTVGADRRRRRIAVTKLLFAANSTITKFILTRTSLALSNSYSSKANVKVFKNGETIDISTDTNETTSWYSPFGNGESITINPSNGNTFTLSKADDVYTIAGTPTPTVTNVESSTYNGLTGFVDGDTCTVNGEPVVFGSAGGGEGGVACFMKGTKILTINGYKLVENITLQDKLICNNGSILPIENLKKSIVKSSTKTNPYLIPKGKYNAIEDLYVSKNHSIYIKGFFVPVKKIKGLKQVILEQEFIEYYHIITNNIFSDIIIANGVEVETYFDINKLTFKTFKKYNKLYYNHLGIRKVDNYDTNLNEIINCLNKNIRKKIKNKNII